MSTTAAFAGFSHNSTLWACDTRQRRCTCSHCCWMWVKDIPMQQGQCIVVIEQCTPAIAANPKAPGLFLAVDPSAEPTARARSVVKTKTAHHRANGHVDRQAGKNRVRRSGNRRGRSHWSRQMVDSEIDSTLAANYQPDPGGARMQQC